MRKFSSLDLQQQTGEIQRAVAKEPVLITNYGKGRSVMLSTEEYCRLKGKAGEPLPDDLVVKRAVTVREPPSPSGYDTTDIASAIRQMTDDIQSGRLEAIVQRELTGVRRLFRNH